MTKEKDKLSGYFLSIILKQPLFRNYEKKTEEKAIKPLCLAEAEEEVEAEDPEWVKLECEST